MPSKPRGQPRFSDVLSAWVGRSEGATPGLRYARASNVGENEPTPHRPRRGRGRTARGRKVVREARVWSVFSKHRLPPLQSSTFLRQLEPGEFLLNGFLTRSSSSNTGKIYGLLRLPTTTGDLATGENDWNRSCLTVNGAMQLTIGLRRTRPTALSPKALDRC
jgi:hypothetical protein